MKIDQYGASFAMYYDKLNADVDYSEMCDFTENVFTRFGCGKITSVCEIACGTGNLAIELAGRGYKVTASDLSEDMLSIADMKARNGKSAMPRFVKADMRHFSLYTPADAIVCYSDGVNYLTKPEDVKACFKSTYGALNKGGLFIFDVNSRMKFEKVYADNAYVLEEQGVLCAWQNYYNPSTRMCDFYLSLFMEDSDGRYIRGDENQRERMYTVRQLSTYLDECGFSLCGIFSDYSFCEADETKHERLYFVCKKDVK